MSRMNKMGPGLILFLVCFSVALGLGAYAVVITDLSDSQKLWSYAGILALWSFVVGVAVDGP